MPQPLMTQVKTIVFLMLENRSLDNVLGWLYQGRKPPYVYPKGSSPDYNGIPPGASQPLDGVQYSIVARPDNLGTYAGYVPYWDPTEAMYSSADWRGVMNQMFGDSNEISGMPTNAMQPRMQGFFQDYYEEFVSQGYDWKDILWMFQPLQLPAINMLAAAYGVSDAWHCSVPTQTNPNRAYSLIGTSQGHNNNHWNAIETYDGTTFLNVLGGAGKTWGLYYTDVWQKKKSFTEYTFPALSNAGGDIGKMDRFFTLLTAGKLPNFSYLEPKWGYSVAGKITQGTDYHPPTDVYPGERFLWGLFKALRTSKQWDEMLFIVTFDEHGGTYDHVAPKWSAINPDGMNGDYGFDFTLFGARVPTLLISPFVKQGTVFRAPAGSNYPFYDHTSFINTFLRWAGVDVNSTTFDLGQRMPAAPHFDDVLFPTAVNHEFLEDVHIPEPDTTRPLNDIFEGVGFASVRRIMDDNDTVEGMKADVARYHADPAAFEAQLGKPRP
jgi:phospholipase C